MPGDSTDFNITVSRENADQLSDVDMIVAYGDEMLLDALQQDELMSQIPAVKNGAVALIDSTTPWQVPQLPPSSPFPLRLMII